MIFHVDLYTVLMLGILILIIIGGVIYAVMDSRRAEKGDRSE